MGRFWKSPTFYSHFAVCSPVCTYAHILSKSQYGRLFSGFWNWIKPCCRNNLSQIAWFWIQISRLYPVLVLSLYPMLTRHIILVLSVILGIHVDVSNIIHVSYASVILGFQAALAQYHENRLRWPREIWDDILQEVPRLLLHRRRWGNAVSLQCLDWNDIQPFLMLIYFCIDGKMMVK